MDLIAISQGDYGYNLDFSITESDGSVRVLTDYTVTLKMWKPGAKETLLIDGGCEIDDEEAGTCHYAVQDGDFDTRGRYHAELELTKTGIVESTEPFIIAVVESG